MKPTKLFSKILIIVLVIFNVGCDQLTKTVVRANVSYDEQISVIDDHFTITKVENSGAFLSSGESLPAPLKFMLLNLMPLLVMTYGIYYLMTKTNLDKLTIVGASFIIGGGIGNLFDRIVYGSVTDFMHIDLIIFQTGVFNVADLSIMTGMFMILLRVYTKKIAQVPA